MLPSTLELLDIVKDEFGRGDTRNVYYCWCIAARTLTFELFALFVAFVDIVS